MFKKLGKRAKALGCVVTDKSKALKGAVVAGATVVMTTVSQAAVTFDTATKTFSGDMDLGAYYSATEIAIGVLAITLAITLGIKMLKKSA